MIKGGMSSFYFIIGNIVLIITKLFKSSKDNYYNTEQQITELGMYTTFKIIGISFIFFVLYKILIELNIL